MSGESHFSSELGREPKNHLLQKNQSALLDVSQTGSAMTKLQVINRLHVEVCQHDMRFHLSTYTKEVAAFLMFRRLCKGFWQQCKHS